MRFANSRSIEPNAPSTTAVASPSFCLDWPERPSEAELFVTAAAIWWTTRNISSFSSISSLFASWYASPIGSAK